MCAPLFVGVSGQSRQGMELGHTLEYLRAGERNMGHACIRTVVPVRKVDGLVIHRIIGVKVGDTLILGQVSF